MDNGHRRRAVRSQESFARLLVGQLVTMDGIHNSVILKCLGLPCSQWALVALTSRRNEKVRLAQRTYLCRQRCLILIDLIDKLTHADGCNEFGLCSEHWIGERRLAKQVE